MKKKEVIQARKFVSWMMSERCNFDCHYCHTHTQKIEPKIVDVTDLITTIKKEYPWWCVAMTGGEPFLYPNFINICHELIRADIKIGLDTNLSQNALVEQFVKRIPPEMVEYIYISVHVEERERIYKSLDGLIKNINLLKKSGFPVQVSYVLHPLLFNRLRDDCEYFEKQSIHIEPKPFCGIYRRKVYPAAYNDEQKQILLSYNPKAFERTTLYSHGLRCRTGMDLVRVWPNGNISRCVADTALLGTTKTSLKLSSVAEPCKVGWCPCFGWDYVIDPITKQRIRENMGDSRVSLFELIKTPRIWKKAIRKFRQKGFSIIFDYV